MKLSFGMIFSIILIIIFVSFAFFAVKKFLDISNTAQVAKFGNALQKDIDKAWKGTQSSQGREYFLPSKIEFVCFADYSKNENGRYGSFYNKIKRAYRGNENLFFYPIGLEGDLNSEQIKHINLSKTTELNNPFCVENIEGKIKLTIEKLYGDALVTIK